MAEKISQYLESRGCICHMPERMEKADGDHTGYRYTDSGMVPENVECVITLGGDGTLIQAARDLAGRQIPMLGINMGTLGYLTQISGQEAITPRLAELVSDQFQLEHRMMLKGTVVRHGKVIAKELALNEIVVARREMLRLLRLNIRVNGGIPDPVPCRWCDRGNAYRIYRI